MGILFDWEFLELYGTGGLIPFPSPCNLDHVLEEVVWQPSELQLLYTSFVAYLLGAVCLPTHQLLGGVGGHYFGYYLPTGRKRTVDCFSLLSSFPGHFIH